MSASRWPDAIIFSVWNSRSDSFSCGDPASSGALRFSISAWAISGVTYFLPAMTCDSAYSSFSGALALFR